MGWEGRGVVKGKGGKVDGEGGMVKGEGEWNEKGRRGSRCAV